MDQTNNKSCLNIAPYILEHIYNSIPSNVPIQIKCQLFIKSTENGYIFISSVTEYNDMIYTVKSIDILKNENNIVTYIVHCCDGTTFQFSVTSSVFMLSDVILTYVKSTPFTLNLTPYIENNSSIINLGTTSVQQITLNKGKHILKLCNYEKSSVGTTVTVIVNGCGELICIDQPNMNYDWQKIIINQNSEKKFYVITFYKSANDQWFSTCTI